MTRKAHLIVLALIASALVAAGCGSDDSLTKAEFIQQGDVICRKFDAKRTTELEKFALKIARADKPITPQQKVDQVKNVLAPSIRSGIEELRELDPPSDEADQIDAILTGAEKAMDEMEEEAEAQAKSGKKTLGTFRDPFTKTAQEAKTYGFKTCFVYY